MICFPILVVTSDWESDNVIPAMRPGKAPTKQNESKKVRVNDVVTDCSYAPYTEFHVFWYFSCPILATFTWQMFF